MIKKEHTKLAKLLREKQTDAERNLWSRLRNTQLNGIKFRRQQPVGDYIVDFVCFEKSLIIEVDGGQHNELVNLNDDKERTTYLENKGYRVIRFWNNDILLNINGVINTIVEMLADN